MINEQKLFRKVAAGFKRRPAREYVTRWDIKTYTGIMNSCIYMRNGGRYFPNRPSSRKQFVEHNIECTARPERSHYAISIPRNGSRYFSFSPPFVAPANPRTPLAPLLGGPGFINHGTLINRETMPRNQDGTKPFVLRPRNSMETKASKAPLRRRTI